MHQEKTVGCGGWQEAPEGLRGGTARPGGMGIAGGRICEAGRRDELLAHATSVMPVEPCCMR